jgi:adenylate cyclase
VLFGLEENNPQIICLNAVKAALAMLQALDRINHYFSDQFDVTFHIGIGIHFGEVIVGEIGHPKNSQFTAIGDVVNTASRIESATKEFQTPLLISRAVTEHVKNTMQLGRLFSASLKGKAQVLELYEVTGGKDE